MQARRKLVAKFGRRGGVALGEDNHRNHRREKVLNAVVELLQKEFLNFVGPSPRGYVPNGYDDPVIEFGDPAVEPTPAEFVFGLGRFAARECPRISRKQLRMFARFRQALQEPGGRRRSPARLS